MAKVYVQVEGICIRDTVRIVSRRMKLDGVVGMVTGIAHGPGLKPYYRVRFCLDTTSTTQSPWFRLSEITYLGDEMYRYRRKHLS